MVAVKKMRARAMGRYSEAFAGTSFLSLPFLERQMTSNRSIQ